MIDSSLLLKGNWIGMGKGETPIAGRSRGVSGNEACAGVGGVKRLVEGKSAKPK